MDQTFSAAGSVLIRVDGNTDVGMGHITRCDVLASALSSRGFEPITFLVRDDPPAVGWVKHTSYELRILSASLSPEEEIAQVRSIQDRMAPRLQIIDLLSNSPEYVARLRYPATVLVSLFDAIDLPDFQNGLIFNHNIVWWEKNREAVSDRIFSGPDYVLLNPAYQVLSRKRAIGSLFKDPRNRIFVNQGGGDPFGLTPKIMRALHAAGLADQTTVLIGPAFRDEEALARAVDETDGKFRVLRGLAGRETASLIASCEIAHSAGGNMMYELACVGAPMLVICHHDKHYQAAEAFQRAGAAANLGLGVDLDEDTIARETLALLDDPERQARMSAAGRALVDGQGADRTAEQIAAACGVRN